MDDQGTAGKSGRRLVLRVLRIAASVVIATACILLVALRTRSYTTCDVFLSRYGRNLAAGVVSFEGQVYLFTKATGRIAGPRTAMPVEEASFLDGKFVSTRTPEFRVAANSVFVVAHHWQVVVWLSTLGVLCWVPLSMKFNLRTMLIATTLLATLLGAAIQAIQ